MASIIQTHKIETSADLESPWARLYYLVAGAEDEATVETLIASVVQPTYLINAVTVVFFKSANKEHLGAGYWSVVVNYSNIEPKVADSPDSISWTFDTTGGNQKISQSIKTVTSAGVPLTVVAPNHHGAINDDGETVHGVDITVPNFAFTVTRIFSQQGLPPNFIPNLYALTGTTNFAPFSATIMGQQLTFAPKECLFLGATGSQRGAQECEITLKFAGSLTQPVTVANASGSTTVTKAGFDYIWCAYQRTRDNPSKSTPNMPLAIYVEQVYQTANFGVFLQ